MPCTTILAGKNATYDGSTMIARNDDAGGNDHFTPKKMIVVQPKEQPRVYKAVLSSVEIPLPENPLCYTAMPNAVEGKGVWGACGVNEARTGMISTSDRGFTLSGWWGHATNGCKELRSRSTTSSYSAS